MKIGVPVLVLSHSMIKDLKTPLHHQTFNDKGLNTLVNFAAKESDNSFMSYWRLKQSKVNIGCKINDQ